MPESESVLLHSRESLEKLVVSEDPLTRFLKDHGHGHENRKLLNIEKALAMLRSGRTQYPDKCDSVLAFTSPPPSVIEMELVGV